MGNTKEDLVRDLGSKPPGAARDALIERAKNGTYHDFDSELVAPKIQLAQDLAEVGFADLVQKVIDGDYDDESPSVAQEEELRVSLGASVYDAVMGKPPRPEN